MTPAQAKAMYRRQIDTHGETITLRRVNPSPAAATTQDVRARVLGYAPEELVGAVQQGDRKIIVLAEDIGAFPVPFRRAFDQVLLRGAQLTVQDFDDSTRRVAGELIAYELRARG